MKATALAVEISDGLLVQVQCGRFMSEVVIPEKELPYLLNRYFTEPLKYLTIAPYMRVIYRGADVVHGFDLKHPLYEDKTSTTRTVEDCGSVREAFNQVCAFGEFFYAPNWQKPKFKCWEKK